MIKEIRGERHFIITHGGNKMTSDLKKIKEELIKNPNTEVQEIYDNIKTPPIVNGKKLCCKALILHKEQQIKIMKDKLGLCLTL
jgi:hypothetical protein